jgi:hypothetical protein
MTSFKEILMMYNIILDSSVEIVSGITMKIDKVSYISCTYEENLGTITIIGDKSPDQDGNIRKKIIVIKQKKDDDSTYFNFECEYTGNFFMGKMPCFFKVYKNSLVEYHYSRY